MTGGDLTCGGTLAFLPMEGHYIRLLGLDANENYRLLHFDIRKIESQFLNIQMSLSEGRRQVRNTFPA